MKTPKFPFQFTEAGVSVKIRKISKTKGRKTYKSFAVDYVLLGQRKLAWRASLEDAKAAASEICIKIAAGEHQVLELKNTDRLAYLRATDALCPVGVKLDIAALEYAQASAILCGRASLAEACREWVKRNIITLPRISVADAAQRLNEQTKADGKTLLRQKQLAAPLGRLAGAFNVEVHTITPGQIAAHLSGLPFTDRTKRNHRDVIGYFNRWLILRGFLPKGTDWLENVQKYSARKLSEIEIYAPDEISRLLTAAGDMVPFIALGAFSGLRHAEIARLDWREIDLDDGYIEVRAAKAKTGERRLVPIHDNLKRWLLPLHKHCGKVVPYANTTKQLLKGAKRAGVAWKHNGLRHSFISYRVAECADVPRVADEAGNSPAMIRQHYLRRVKPPAATAWFSVAPQTEGKIITFSTIKPERLKVTA